MTEFEKELIKTINGLGTLILIGIAFHVMLVLTALKLTGFLSVSWWWIFAPLWIPFMISFVKAFIPSFIKAVNK